MNPVRCQLRSPLLSANLIELDIDAQIDLDLAKRVAQVLKLTIGVGSRIADDNRAAPATNHLV